MARDPDWPVIPWAEWKANAINRVFQQFGKTKQLGKITADTVRHGEQCKGRKSNREELERAEDVALTVNTSRG